MRIKRRINKRYALFICIFYFFVLRDWLEQIIPFTRYFDEILALLSIPLFILDLKRNLFKIKIKRGGVENTLYFSWSLVY